MGNSVQFLLAAIVPLLILGGLVAWAIIATYNEWRLKKRLMLPSACLRCKHGVDQSMLEAGRCPECGVAYVFAGIDTPRQRLETHVKTSSIVGVIVLGSVILALVLGQASAQFLPDYWPALFGIATLAAGIALPLWLLGVRRGGLRRQIDAMEIEASRHLDEQRAPRKRA